VPMSICTPLIGFVPTLRLLTTPLQCLPSLGARPYLIKEEETCKPLLCKS
jgi:hypothetical protein